MDAMTEHETTHKPKTDPVAIRKEALMVLLDSGTTVHEKRMAGFVLDVLVLNGALVDACKSMAEYVGISKDFLPVGTLEFALDVLNALKDAGEEL